MVYPYKKLHTAIFIVLIFSIILAGCTPTNNTKSEPSSSAKAPASTTTDKTLTISWPKDIGPLNPHEYTPNEFFAQGMYYEPLIDYGEGGKLVPKLAESWDISEDGKTYTFHLHKNVKFSDGSDFDANVVQKNFDTILANRDMHSWLGLISEIEKTEVVDANTFKVILKNRYYPALQEFAVVRPLRFLGAAGFPDDGNTAKGIKKPITTGPWVLTEYKKDEEAVFTRNENYWGTKPKINKLVVKVIPDGEARVLALQKGNIDLIWGEGVISLDSFVSLRDSGKFKTSISNPVATRTLIVNTAKGPFADLNVRLALQHAVNKKALVDGVTNGVEKVADTVISSNFPYANVGLKPYDFNVETAKQLLDQAGWKLPAGKTIREKDGKPLEIELVYMGPDQIEKPMAAAIQSDLKQVGISLKTTGLERELRNKRMESADFDLLFWGTYGAPYDPHNFVSTNYQPGYGIFESQQGLSMKDELHQQMKDVLLTTDEKERQKIYTSIFTTLHDQAVYLPISYLTNIAVYPNYVKDLKFPAHRDETPFDTIDIQK
ncbi:nickel ABC transporter, nickel/metallophore periplasmic binding protein [Paenibacillus chitinolyticus]|uniref:Nickel ABC transporter substrate-binding protein n=1 Tax=Paenibacillus chitinolyticus TaxID=79263 RepID=A0A410WXV7_9BACL|nr:nickel ABC transporter substrate-binding protein [Paenibacillus chitinolyticus]MCY9589899.1 nickel ABC transporter substrate-binding protein [Paenibacillus chitinolyticus]MCY9596236.1 nickel ABC transporter substrate-binding protein [Paenibacillus chitinolyticus]QAV19269.1 nickel ABC transporter, nickel/metallophore periplasmic binding protein [Paenibacillus chitinolyticus]